MRKLIILLALVVAGVMPATANAASFGFSTESTSEFRAVQAAIPTTYWAPFVSMKYSREFNYYLNMARYLNATPMISWESWNGKKRLPGTHHKPEANWGNTSIANGKQDAYLIRQARYTKLYGKPVYIRFDHEMNGTWYPWSVGPSKEYVRMWKHVWGIFHRLHVKNVRWVWSPNSNTFQQDAAFDKHTKRYWPGSKYVNVVGMTLTRVKAQGACYANAEWFFRRFDRLLAYKKPMWITESLVDSGEMKMWMPQYRQQIDKRPYIGAAIWLSTSGPQQDKFGNMNWMLSKNPFAWPYLTFKVGYAAPAATEPAPPLC